MDEYAPIAAGASAAFPLIAPLAAEAPRFGGAPGNVGLLPSAAGASAAFPLTPPPDEPNVANLCPLGFGAPRVFGGFDCPSGFGGFTPPVAGGFDNGDGVLLFPLDGAAGVFPLFPPRGAGGAPPVPRGAGAPLD